MAALRDFFILPISTHSVFRLSRLLFPLIPPQGRRKQGEKLGGGAGAPKNCQAVLYLL